MNRNSSKPKARHSRSVEWEISKIRDVLIELSLRCEECDQKSQRLPDSQIVGDMAALLCVRVSGYLEQAVAIILREYCSKNSWGMAEAFAHAYLDKTPNMNSDALLKLIGRFDKGLSSQLLEYLEVDEKRQRLNALVGIRNNIAHGKSQTVSSRQALEYLEVVQEVIDWLLREFHALS